MTGWSCTAFNMVDVFVAQKESEEEKTDEMADNALNDVNDRLDYLYEDSGEDEQ